MQKRHIIGVYVYASHSRLGPFGHILWHFIWVLPPLTEPEPGWGPDAQDMGLWEVIAVSLQGSADTWKRNRTGEAGKLEVASTWAITWSQQIPEIAINSIINLIKSTICFTNKSCVQFTVTCVFRISRRNILKVMLTIFRRHYSSLLPCNTSLLGLLAYIYIYWSRFEFSFL